MEDLRALSQVIESQACTGTLFCHLLPQPPPLPSCCSPCTSRLQPWHVLYLPAQLALEALGSGTGAVGVKLRLDRGLNSRLSGPRTDLAWSCTSVASKPRSLMTKEEGRDGRDKGRVIPVG